MKHFLPLGVVAAIFTFVSGPLSAQPPEPGFEVNPPNRKPFVGLILIPAPLVRIESIDVAAKSITVREIRFGRDQKPLPAEPMKVPLAADAQIVRIESALRASELRIGDVVTVLGQKMPARPRPKLFAFDEGGNEQPLTPNLWRSARGNLRTASRAEKFQVIALPPQLLLRRGGAPLDPNPGAALADTPFSNGDGKIIGSLSFAKAKDGAGTVTTLLLTHTANLEFARATSVALSEIAPQHTVGEISIQAELSDPADGKREVTRMTVSNIKRK